MEMLDNFLCSHNISLPIFGAIIIAVFFLFSFFLKFLSRLRSSAIYKAANTLGLQIIVHSSGGASVPRAMGTWEDRNIEIVGYNRFQDKQNLRLVRIKTVHKAYVVRKVVVRFSPSEESEPSRITVNNEESNWTDLLKMEVFDEKALEDILIYLRKYAKGKASQDSFLTIEPNEFTFDRDLSLLGDENHIISCIDDTLSILKYLESKSGKK